MALLEAFKTVMQHQDLSEDEARDAMLEIMSGSATPELIAGFVAVMRYKRETVAEITGFARAMRAKGVRIAPKVSGRLTDTCGTGGAAVKSFNISTASAFVTAAAGAPVAKHGNKSVTRPSGSADVLTALGANLQLTPSRVQEIIETAGVGFLLAPSFHPAIKSAMPTRHAFQVRTVFNLLGPLNNPAGAQGQVLGVFADEHVEPMAHVLARLGTEHALVLHGEGMDEANLAGVTHICEVRDGSVKNFTIRGKDFGYPAYVASAWAPLSPADSANEIRTILGGKAKGARRDIVEYNAGLGVYVSGRAKSIEAGIRRAREILGTDLALAKLDEFIAATRAKEVQAV